MVEEIQVVKYNWKIGGTQWREKESQNDEQIPDVEMDMHLVLSLEEHQKLVNTVGRSLK